MTAAKPGTEPKGETGTEVTISEEAETATEMTDGTETTTVQTIGETEETIGEMIGTIIPETEMRTSMMTTCGHERKGTLRMMTISV